MKCDIKAYNGAGDSQIASSPNITVYCAREWQGGIDLGILQNCCLLHICFITAPMPPTDLAKLEEEKTIDAGRERWRYKISWKVCLSQ